MSLRLKLAFRLMNQESGETPSSTGSGAAPDSQQAAADDDREGTDTNVDWDQESQQVILEEGGTPPARQETQQQQDTQQRQQTQQQKPPQQQQQQQQAPAQQQTQQQAPQETQQAAQQTQQQQATPDQQQQQQAQQPPQQQQAGETPEQRQQREQREQQQAQERHTKLVQRYTLPDDLAARLATEPEAVLPELAARIHQSLMAEVQDWSTRFIPAFFQTYQQGVEADRRAKEEFYSAWPGLKGKETQVLQVGAMFRQMNPKATPQEALDMVGSMVCAALGIDPNTARAQQQQQQQRQVQQQRPPQQTFRPAATASSQAGAPPPEDNLWANEAETMIQEDRGG